MADSRKIATASLFGVIIAIVKGPILPPPTGDLLIVVEATLLALSFILLGVGGATLTAAVAGLLINILEPQYSFYPFALAVLYGALTDALCSGLKVRSGEAVSSKRAAIAMTISSTIVGPVAYYATVYVTPILPNDPAIYGTIVVVGVISGAIGGLLAVRLWNRNLSARFKAVSQPPAQPTA
ncbi:MAG: hypothetical protein HY247_05125 [archaeon]|nr:MAG: hypothetical protein HY247_05125 [archaeon]